MSSALKHRKSASAFTERKNMELSNIEAILWNYYHQCHFECHSKIPNYFKDQEDLIGSEKNAEIHYSQLYDLKCESQCEDRFAKMLRSIDKREIKASIEENELCHTQCLIPRRGATDQVLCIEQCYQQHNKRMSKVLQESTQGIIRTLNEEFKW